MLSSVIHARGLARTFRKKKQEVHAVVGVDLDVEAREIVGFLGPNGAGKTTTLRMLTTPLEPTAGTATVAGRDLRTDPVGVRRRIGYVSQSGSTYPEARSGEGIVDHARLYVLHAGEAGRRGDARPPPPPPRPAPARAGAPRPRPVRAARPARPVGPADQDPVRGAAP